MQEVNESIINKLKSCDLYRVPEGWIIDYPEFEKLGVGDYLIKGSSGFAQEGWYVETPKDANGNPLVAVVYEQLENGDISVKTYDYMLNKKGRIVADTETPLDIPESRWIDIRLQELPQPEIEVTDDPKQ